MLLLPDRLSDKVTMTYSGISDEKDGTQPNILTLSVEQSDCPMCFMYSIP